MGEWLRGRKHGKGEFIYVDGSRYSGDWKDDRPSGQGKLSWRNGIVYEGSWAEGKVRDLSLPQLFWFGAHRSIALQFHGYGMLTNGRGEMYRGDWVNGKKEGKGVMTYVGSSYDGQWKNDKVLA